MSTETTKTEGLYYTIIDGTFRRRVADETPGSIRREYETSKGDKGVKWEMLIDSLEGTIEDMQIVEGDFGRTLSITLDANADGVHPHLQFNVEGTYGEDVLKKLPAVDLTQPVKFRPYAFTDQTNGKEVRGVEIKQGETKFKNYFYDAEAKTVINGMPKPEEDTSRYSKDDWKVYFITVRKFLIAYFLENVQPKLQKKSVVAEAQALSVGDIPFDDNGF
jgi:hypothetical protein